MKAIKDLFGIEYHVYVIEFQKRGLPHAHIVLKVVRNLSVTHLHILMTRSCSFTES